MKSFDIKGSVRERQRKNRRWFIALGVGFGLASIYLDDYLRPELKAIGQEILWSVGSVACLFMGMKNVLKNSRLLLPFALTLLVQWGMAYLMRSLFPLSNSLLLFVFLLPGIFVLAICFAGFARLLDPHGARPE